MRLILFDIDGTLITARGAGRRAIKRALQAVFGTTGSLDTYEMSGKTDPRIIYDLMEAGGVDRALVKERLDEYFEAYAESLIEEIGDGRDVVTMPGVADLVRRLDAAEDVVLGLLTGNIEEGARIKLGPTGLLPYFVLGAFGSDEADRRRLPSLAARRAHALRGHPFRAEEVMVIGDTPHDVDCARHFGAVAVAVATGRFTRAQLEGERPDLLFDDFADVELAARTLLSHP
jgi:phosphoglycolate phosphatase-like HAD superfamily hydrolase